MAEVKIPRRLSTAILNSLSAGVVPRVGLEYIAVGRKDEIAALLSDLENIASGGAAFRFLIGRYGSGKSFMLQLLRNYALERNFVVADVDLSPERRLWGSNGEGLATYREAMHNLSTKTRPDGGALAAVLERWISDVLTLVQRESSLDPASPEFGSKVNSRILEQASSMEGLVHGFDFATVLSSYWRGYQEGNDGKKEAALRWLRGEFTTKTEARQALGVRVIVDDDSWYDTLKLLANFVTAVGYQGLLFLLDEAANLYKIAHTISRTNNYEKLLTLFNDTLQGKAERIGILVGGTSQFLEDPRRGLYSYEALRTRLQESRFRQDGLKDTSGPILRLQVLSHEEIFVLLTRLSDVYSIHHGLPASLSASQIQMFMQEVVNRLGAQELLTPREVVRDFLAVLDLLRQNPHITFQQLVQGADFKPTTQGQDPEQEPSAQFAEFKL